MARYREAMYDAAYRIAHDEASGRALADSLYAQLYGLTDRGEVRASKLQYYLGRGSLAGWLRTVMAQEYVNQYRRTRRETSLEAAVEDGKQFAASEPDTRQTDPRIEAATVGGAGGAGGRRALSSGGVFHRSAHAGGDRQSDGSSRVDDQPQAGARDYRLAQAHSQTAD